MAHENNDPAVIKPVRPDKRLALMAIAVVVAVMVGVLLITRIGHSDPAATAAQSSTDAAHFDLPALTGSGRVRLSDFHRRPLVVTFFASWCTACRGEALGFLAVRSAVVGAVAFVGVDSMETGDGAAFPKEIGIGDWPLARDVGGTSDSGLHDAVGGQGLPVTAFYDGNGKLLTVHIGAIAEDTLRAELRSLYGIHV
jgi:cytochrome c biogenesis protein CcmG/thiol:disulfide interchange protein DsbE